MTGSAICLCTKWVRVLSNNREKSHVVRILMEYLNPGRRFFALGKHHAIGMQVALSSLEHLGLPCRHLILSELRCLTQGSNGVAQVKG